MKCPSMTRNQELGLWTVVAAMLTQLTPLFDGNVRAHYICLAIGAGLSTRAAYLVKSEPRASETPDGETSESTTIIKQSNPAPATGQGGTS